MQLYMRCIVKPLAVLYCDGENSNAGTLHFGPRIPNPSKTGPATGCCQALYRQLGGAPETDRRGGCRYGSTTDKTYHNVACRRGV